MKFLILLVSFSIYAGFSQLDLGDQYSYEKEKKSGPLKIKKTTRRKKKREIDSLTKKLLEKDQEILTLLKKRDSNLILKRPDDKIIALTRVKGVVLNSILAMNIKPSKFIVKLSGDHPYLEEAELRCLGHSFDKRIPAHCNLMVLNESEYKVDIDVWDLDGAEGIIADYFYTGEEKTFLTSSFASFLEGILNVAKDRITTPFGQATKVTAKNQVLNGLSGIASNAKEKIIESGEKKLSIAYVNSGKEVLLFFNSTLNLKEEVR